MSPLQKQKQKNETSSGVRSGRKHATVRSVGGLVVPSVPADVELASTVARLSVLARTTDKLFRKLLPQQLTRRCVRRKSDSVRGFGVYPIGLCARACGSREAHKSDGPLCA